MAIKKKKEVEQRQFVFTSKEIDIIIEKGSMGFALPRYMNPWFKNQVGVRRTGCPFGWTQEEFNEFAKCKLDIHYFANHYCKIKTEDGTVKQMKLRKYQYRVLDVYDKNRFVINMSSRQTGKCIDRNSKIHVSHRNEDGSFNPSFVITMEDLFAKLGVSFDKNDVPVYDNNPINKVWFNKIVSDSNMYVESIDGWTKIHELNIVKKMPTIRIEAENGAFLEGADMHLIMTKKGWQTLDTISIGDSVIVGNDILKITRVELSKEFNELYDISTGTGDYLSTGTGILDPNYFINYAFLSHNTITAAITLLHYCIFNKNKGVMIVANKSDTVVEIIDKIKNIYKLLPFFLKPGIINWNSKAIVFDNGCRIKSQARSKEPAIGFTIDFLYMDEFAHLPSSIARHYYKAAVPTVSSINNSKILITSTPNGSNLFKELVNGAEVPDGHPDKNQYKCIRVYWHEVEGRLDPKFYPLETEMRKWKVTFPQVEKLLKSAGYKIFQEKEQSDTGEKSLIRIDYENGKYPVEKLREFDVNGIKLGQLGMVTNWQETETKLIGGEEAFNQEYNIQFISGAKRILNAKTAKRLEDRKTVYSWEKLDILEKLRFTYDELKWHPEFVHSERNKYYWVTSIDTSEGLGLDYSILNMFRVMAKDISWLKENKIKNLYEAFYLKQTALFQHNRIHPTELADLFYLLQFEYLNPEKAKCVLEINGPGGRFLDALPNCFDQNNNYGNYVFVRYKHNQKDKFKKIGKKVTSNKKDDVKLYIDALEKDNIYVDESNSILEVENFIKVESRSGNISYKADSGHDDIVMTKVNLSTLFELQEWKNMCHEYYKELDSITQAAIDSALDLTYNPQAMGYKSVSNAMKSVKNGVTSRGRFNR